MKVEFVQNGEVVLSQEVGEGSHKIGRGADCDIKLTSTRISKQHALLVIKGGKAAIIDLGSANGIFVNGVLVRKQRIQAEDDVIIADFRLRLAPAAPPRRERSGGAVNSPGVSGGGFEGNLAFAAVPEPASVVELTPQEKLLQLMDEKILVPFYGIVRVADWRWVLVSILMSSLVASVLLSVIPIVRWGKSATTKESLARAHTILGQCVRENYRILSKTNDFTRLTVEAAESEEGMLAAYVVDPKTSAILAPGKLFNKTVNDVYSLLAMKKVTEGKEELVSVEQGDNTYIVAEPIYLFSQEANDRVLQAIVLGTFQVTSGITSTFEPLVEASLFAVLMSLGAFFLIYKMMTRPVVLMQEQLDAALKGENVQVTCEAKFPELETLATVINFSISRMKSGGGFETVISAEDGDIEDSDFIASVRKFEQGSTDGQLLLDRDKKVVYVGRILEELIGLRDQYAKGQNISDACRDQAFAGTTIDLVEKVNSSLGESQSAVLDVNGISRTVFAVGHKNKSGELRFVLVTVRMNGA